MKIVSRNKLQSILKVRINVETYISLLCIWIIRLIISATIFLARKRMENNLPGRLYQGLITFTF